MYKDFFGFKELPFETGLEVNLCYESERKYKIEKEILETIKQFKVPFLTITGKKGSGKSTLGIKLLRELLREDDYNAALLIVTGEQTDFEALSKGIVRQVNSSGSKIKSITDFIEEKYNTEKKRTLFIIDNSDNIAGEKTLLSLFRLTELKDENGGRIVSFVLLGLPEINKWIEKNEKFKKITKQYNMEPFSFEEMKEFINQNLELSGGGQEIFSEKVKEKIFEFLDKKDKIVFPFWINILCDAVLLQSCLLNELSPGVNLAENVLKKIILQIKN
ncbi:AAA family ATPase [bacterium]|nr:AAA family ATPase [bacterium]